MKPVTVIAGSGPSLHRVDVRRIPADAAIIRVNNFFLEPVYHLGRRVDCVYFSADPRAARFYVATLRRIIARGEYDIRGTASHLPASARFKVPGPFEFFEPRDPTARSLLARLYESDGIRPTSGAMAMLYAVERGAESLVLAGIDFYDGAKYAHTPPPRLGRVLRPNLSPTGYDERLHAQEADLAVLELLMDRGIEVRRASDRGSAVVELPPAPVLQPGTHVSSAPKPVPYVDDWVEWDGLRNLGMLFAARGLRRRLRGL